MMDPGYYSNQLACVLCAAVSHLFYRQILRLCHCNRDSIGKLRQQNWVKEPQTASFERRSRQFQLGNNCNEGQLFKTIMPLYATWKGIVVFFQAMSSILPILFLPHVYQ